LIQWSGAEPAQSVQVGSTILALTVSDISDLVAVGTQDGKLYLWEHGLAEPGVKVPLPGTVPVTSIALLDNGKYLVFGRGEMHREMPGGIQIYDPVNRKILRDQASEQAGVRGVCSLPGKRELVWSDGRGGLHHWNLGNNIRRPLQGHRGGTSLRASPDGRLVASATSDYRIHLCDLEKLAERRVLTGHKGRVDALAFHPDGSILASGSWGEREVKLWDLATDTVRATYTSVLGRVRSLAWSPDGLLLAAGNGEGTLTVLDMD
jgi:WD40 repeat protein